MKLTTIALAILLMFSTGAIAQSCTGISDEAGIIKDANTVTQGADVLINQGADVHVVTVANLGRYGSRLADVEKAYETHCPNWMAPNGNGRKANLFVLIVAPSVRLKNVFFGGAYSSVYRNEDTINTIFSQAANPYFRQGQFDAGIAAALKDFGNKVVAFHDQQQHPVQAVSTTTINEHPADLSGLWTFLGWLLGIGVIVGLILFIVHLVQRRKEEQEEVAAAQQSAVAAQGKAASAFRSADKSANGYSVLAERYTELSQSLASDPNESGLSAQTYASIERSWNDLAFDIRSLSGGNIPKPPSSSSHSSHSKKTEDVHRRAATVTGEAKYTPPPAPPSQQPSTVVVHNNSNDLLTGMLIGEALSNNNEETHHHHRDDDESSSSSSRSSGGSDSSWGSSDSGSSGSDSSWGSGSDSGSSDFGGGGGGGSDSSW